MTVVADWPELLVPTASKAGGRKQLAAGAQSCNGIDCEACSDWPGLRILGKDDWTNGALIVVTLRKSVSP